VSLVDVGEIGAPPDVEPILWRLLTTRAVEDAAMAWCVIDRYRQRWTIGQFFRTLKRQGPQLEDSPAKDPTPAQFPRLRLEAPRCVNLAGGGMRLIERSRL
jgi:hypothetical protein